MGSLETGADRLILNGREDRKEKEEEEEEEEEPILKEQNQRFCMFPIRYNQLWEMYKKAEASFWTGNFSFFLSSLTLSLLLFSFTYSLFFFYSFTSISLCLELGTCVLLCFLEFLCAIHGHGYL
jgi:hypothetical protein